MAARVATAGAAPVRHFVAAAGSAEALRLAEAAAASGASVIPIGTDITPVYCRLDLALRESPFALAGVTSASDFFVLERLAWDRGLRTALRRELHADSAAHTAGTPRGPLLEWRLEPRAGS